MMFIVGNKVTVSDQYGNYLYRGVIRAKAVGKEIYDVLPDNHKSLSELKMGILPGQMRHIAAPVLAYDRKIPQGARHVDDYA